MVGPAHLNLHGPDTRFRIISGGMQNQRTKVSANTITLSIRSGISPAVNRCSRRNNQTAWTAPPAALQPSSAAISSLASDSIAVMVGAARVAAIGANNPAFRILGYTTRMHELMRISDLFVGKPGGLTTSEATACGLPMPIVSPIPGQEERNSDHLLEQGAAIKCNEMTTIPFKIDWLLDDPQRLARMAARALALGRPHAAHEVVRTLLEDDLPPLILREKQREAMAQAAARE